MTKELEEFSSLFDLTPNIPILNINTTNKDISNTLENLIKPFNGHVTNIQSTNERELKAKIKRAAYDYGIIYNSILNADNKETLMELINIGIRDSGYIIVIEDKEKDDNKIYALLEEFDYGAIGSIDIFKNYNLIMAKKVHMWGM